MFITQIYDNEVNIINQINNLTDTIAISSFNYVTKDESELIIVTNELKASHIHCYNISNNSLLWSKKITGDYINIKNITELQYGNIIIVGDFMGQIRVNNIINSLDGMQDLISIQLDANGNIITYGQKGINNPEIAHDIVSDGFNNIAYCGNYLRNTTVDGKTFTANPNFMNLVHPFYSGFNASSVSTLRSAGLFDFMINPNPFNSEFVIDLTSYKEDNLKLKIVAYDGRIVLEDDIPLGKGENRYIVSESQNWVNGLYNVIISKDFETLSKKVVKID